MTFIENLRKKFCKVNTAVLINSRSGCPEARDATPRDVRKTVSMENISSTKFTKGLL